MLLFMEVLTVTEIFLHLIEFQLLAHKDKQKLAHCHYSISNKMDHAVHSVDKNAVQCTKAVIATPMEHS